jgi:hypothetical protein
MVPPTLSGEGVPDLSQGQISRCFIHTALVDPHPCGRVAWCAGAQYYQSSVAIFLSEGRRSHVSSRWYVLATDVGHPLISLLDLIGHRPRRRGCDGREPSPFARHGTGFRRDAGGGHVAPIGDWVSNNPVLPVSCGSCGTSTSHAFRRSPLYQQAVVPFGFPHLVSC